MNTDPTNTAGAVPSVPGDEEIMEIVGRATAAPWGINGNADGRAYGVSAYREGYRGAPVVVWRGIARPKSAEGLANGRLIAISPTVIPALLERARRAEEALSLCARVIEIAALSRRVHGYDVTRRAELDEALEAALGSDALQAQLEAPHPKDPK